MDSLLIQRATLLILNSCWKLKKSLVYPFARDPSFIKGTCPHLWGPGVPFVMPLQFRDWVLEISHIFQLQLCGFAGVEKLAPEMLMKPVSPPTTIKHTQSATTRFPTIKYTESLTVSVTAIKHTESVNVRVFCNYPCTQFWGGASDGLNSMRSCY